MQKSRFSVFDDVYLVFHLFTLNLFNKQGKISSLRDFLVAAPNCNI